MSHLQMRAPWIPAEEQLRLGREAKAFYCDPRHPICNLKQPTELDRLMLSLFESIEGCRVDIDAKLAALGRYVRQQDIFTRFFSTTPKIKITWQAMAYELQERDRGNDKSDARWQMRINWNRLLRTVGPTWGSTYTISPEWIGPMVEPTLEAPKAETDSRAPTAPGTE